jgi:hypothetical protein
MSRLSLTVRQVGHGASGALAGVSSWVRAAAWRDYVTGSRKAVGDFEAGATADGGWQLSACFAR